MSEDVTDLQSLVDRAEAWGPLDILRTTDPTSILDEYLAEHSMTQERFGDEMLFNLSGEEEVE